MRNHFTQTKHQNLIGGKDTKKPESSSIAQNAR